MKALLFCGGPFPHQESMKIYTEGFDLVIAVDSGYLHAKSVGVVPHVLIGDFDSLDEDQVSDAEASGIEIIVHPPQKDMTDTHIALEYALDKGCTSVRMLGALGRRMDHTLSNMSLLKWLSEQGAAGEIIDAYNEVYYLDSELTLVDRIGQTMSVVPIVDLTGLTLSGVAYPLVDRTVPFASSLCVSNRITQDRAYVALKSGRAYIMLTKD